MMGFHLCVATSNHSNGQGLRMWLRMQSAFAAMQIASKVFYNCKITIVVCTSHVVCYSAPGRVH
jgi:hypothetical protein